MKKHIKHFTQLDDEGYVYLTKYEYLELVKIFEKNRL